MDRARLYVIAPVVAMAAWLLLTAIRTGEFRYKSWRMGNLAHVVRSEQPTVYWIYVALHLFAIGYLTAAAVGLLS